MTGRPEPLSDHVRAQMSRMPRRDTRPELRLRHELHRRGLRYRVALRGLPGTPDLAFTRARIAVFVDGCFWHSCPIHGSVPKNNSEWWRIKLATNRERDCRKDSELEQRGWLPVHVWEHEDPVSAADRIERLWRERRR